MDADMNAMGMRGDAAWTALADSVRADLATLPELSGAPLSALVRAHAARVRRLMTTHGNMMAMPANP